jgi:hypothetical protein
MTTFKGRRALPIEHPETSSERFAWLIRAARSYHIEPEIRRSKTFAAKLAPHLHTPLRPETLNRMENAQLNFTTERIRAYEKVLGQPQDSLVDAYIYLMRLEDAEPRWEQTSQRGLTPQDYDSLFMALSQHPMTPTLWLNLCHSIATRENQLLDSPRCREALCSGLLEDFGRSFERDERILRESLALLGACAVPYIVEYANAYPITHFNAIEALGLMKCETAWEALVQLASTLNDSVQAQTLIEPLRRWIRREPERLSGLLEVCPSLVPYCTDLLCEPTEAFTAREEAIALLSTPGVRVTDRARKNLSHYREDLQQLRIRPTKNLPPGISAQIAKSACRILLDSSSFPPSMPLLIPGLGSILDAGIFSKERVQRLGMAVVLAPLKLTDEVAGAMGKVLLNSVPASDYGTQRSLLRLMTKLDRPAAHPYFSAFAKTSITDEGTRVSIAWALGMASGSDDEVLLEQLSIGSSVVARRVIALAAARRGYAELLESLAKDPSAVVSQEASQALRRIRRRSDGKR